MSIPKEPARELFNHVVDSSQGKICYATLDDLKIEFEKNYFKYLSYARLLTPSLMGAEDLVQQAFSNTVKQIRKGNAIILETLGGYVTSSIRNQSIKTFKKESSQPKIYSVQEFEKSPDVIHLLSLDKQLLLDAIAKLIPSQRTITIMFYFDGMKVEEIATELGLSQSAIKTNLMRARKNLFNSVSEHLENQGVSDEE